MPRELSSHAIPTLGDRQRIRQDDEHRFRHILPIRKSP
jgi:hypothetical protein